MRKLTGSVFLSLDGVMQAPGGPTEDWTGGFDHGGWMFPLSDEMVGAAVGALFDAQPDLLLGRKTYDIFAAYWPYVQGEEAAFGALLNDSDKYVLTRGRQPLDWEKSHRLADIDAVAALKDGDGPDLLIQGSSTIYAGLLAAGLIDRLVAITFPLVLGRGKRIFGPDTPPGALKLVDCKVTPTGAIIATYEPSGAVQVGTFLTQKPSARETARQEKMKQAG